MAWSNHHAESASNCPSCSAAAHDSSSISLMSGFPSPPSGRKNFAPFLFAGRWLAVAMMPAWHPCFSKMHDINIAGVVHIPNCTTRTPSDPIPAAIDADRRSLERRGSFPMDTLRLDDTAPSADFRALSQRANPTPM